MAALRGLPAVAVFLAAASLALAAEGPSYPETPVGDTIHTYGNVRLPDPFFWLEEHESEEAAAWFRAQSAHTRERIAAMPEREDLYERIRGIDEAKTVQIYRFDRRGDRFFYLKREVGEEVGRLFYRDGMDGEEHLIVDPADFAETDMVHAIDYYNPSWDGELVAVGIAPGGSEIPILYLVEALTGEARPQSIPRVQWDPAWLADDSGFYYSQLRQEVPGEDRVERYKRKPVKFHRLGTDPSVDPVVISYDKMPLPALTEVATPIVFPIPETPYTIGLLAHGVDRSRTLYVAEDLDPAASEKADWRLLVDREEEVETLAIKGDRIFFLSGKEAPRKKILEGDLADFDKAELKTILPESDRILNEITVLGGDLYVSYMKGGLDGLLRLDLAEREAGFRDVELPLIGRVTLLANDEREEDVYISLTSWERAPAYYRYDPVAETVKRSPLRPLGPYDAPENVVTERVLVLSHDGVEVPLTLIHLDDLEKDGANPTILYGYGAYGNPLRPFFSPTRLAWLERGGIFAIAHVRGGGEFGKEWHEGGHIETKRNSWLDFHACAEWMIDNGYTASEHLGAQGGSMGGVLVGRAMTSRPGLYGAVVSNVGNHNPVRNHRRANGPANYPEYGNPLDPEEFPYVLAMDSYFAVREGVEYPPMLLTTGYNDSRVDPWMPGKMAARLQQVNPDGGPHLLRVEFAAGHGRVARSDALAELADIYAFFRWALD
ncbi:MAG: prolyl oligopeptidase family serine peptidase [Verrucomicrobia bacterium]|nr:prolyl oligopeptidase family serine peptidase [Verrucomicrobiota bacterium]